MSVPLAPYIQAIARGTTTFRFSLLNVGLFAIAVPLRSIDLGPDGHLLERHRLGSPRRGTWPLTRTECFVGRSNLGFAIIPLIYTISEDALQSVPQHLRSASLGCGATTWQTTIRIVVPTAMSGLFSALMIGFGRAWVRRWWC